MQTNGQRPEPPDLSHFDENRRKVSPEQLKPYYGLFVAWSPDGTRILASGEDRRLVLAKLKEAGIPSSQVVFDYIDPPDVVLL